MLCVKKQNYQPVHKIHLFFPKKRPCKKKPGPSPIRYVPDLCHRLLVPVLSRPSAPPAVQFGEVGVSGSTSETKGTREREGERGWRSVDAQRGSRSEKWDLHKKNYKMPTNASLWVAGVQDDASYLLLTVKDDFHRFIFYFFASGCTFKKKKKDVTHVFLHLISIFHPSMSQNECNVMIQVAAF